MKTTAKACISAMILGAACVAWSDTINGVNIDFVPIGYANNTANGDNFGAVGYNYSIGRYEITYAQFVASGIVDVDGPANYWQGQLSSDSAPVVNITWHQAAQYCNWLTTSNVNLGAYAVSGGLVTGIDRDSAAGTYGTVYVLPTENEWYKAAYYTGSGYSLYANGTGTAPVHGTDANYAAAGGYLGGPAWVVGSGTAEQNGTYDMMGNVFEWMETATNGVPGDVSSVRAFRGGDYFQGVSKLGSDFRGSAPVDGEYYNTGFRVVAIPEPGTISFMSLSTVGLFLTRTVRRRKFLGKTLLPIRTEHRCDAFCPDAEWLERNRVEEEDEDSLDIAMHLLADRAVRGWQLVRSGRENVSRVFWNYMVVRHERRVARRQAFRTALKKKALDGFDAFLALIMK